MMWRLAADMIRARPAAYLASALVIAMGTMLLTAFAALAETGITETATDAEALTTLAAIMGGWAVVIVVFGIASTVTLMVEQRRREMALARAIGATPRQVQQLVLMETLAVAVPSVAAGVVPGLGLGSFLLGRMIDVGVVQEPIHLVAGWPTVVAGAAVSLLASAIAAVMAGRRASTVAPVLALVDSSDSQGEPTPGSRVKLAVGAGFVVLGFGFGISTLFMANGPTLAATAGPACIGVAIGSALLSPGVVALVGRLAHCAPGGVSRLAVHNLAARSARSSTVVGPLALLVGIATGTLYMQSTEDSTAKIAGAQDDFGAQFAAANYLVVAMIIAFCALAVTNTLIAATWHRRREFGLLRLTSATRRQVIGMVAVESAVSTAIAVILGTIAAAATAVPYSIVKTGSPIPSGPPWMYPAIAAGGFVIAFAATSSTTIRATQARPTAALAIA